MTTQLVNILTVDELKEVIANVVDARLNSFLASLSVDITSKFSEIVRDLPKVEPNSLSREYKLYRGYASQDRKNAVISPQTNPVEDVKKENPWLKIAGMHKDNADLFEEVVAYMEASRQEILEELA